MIKMYTIVVLDETAEMIGYYSPGDIGSNTTTGIVSSKERCEACITSAPMLPPRWAYRVREVVFA